MVIAACITGKKTKSMIETKFFDLLVSVWYNWPYLSKETKLLYEISWPDPRKDINEMRQKSPIVWVEFLINFTSQSTGFRNFFRCIMNTVTVIVSGKRIGWSHRYFLVPFSFMQFFSCCLIHKSVIVIKKNNNNLKGQYSAGFFLLSVF